MRGVALQAGEHRIVLRYAVKALTIASRLTVVSLTVLAVLVVVGTLPLSRRQRRRGEAE